MRPRSVCVCAVGGAASGGEICRYIQLVVQRFQTGAPFKFRAKKMDQRQKYSTLSFPTNNKEIRH